eukprot:m.566264 g.566264  ORF g.566264 m.566264 type:complete len:598 (+) comp22248_c0_seq15:177-1970(+)
MAHSPLPKRARWGDQLDNIRRVLVVNTGGTIGMVDKGRGYEPERGFMEGFLRKLSMFHDTDAYDPELHGPGLLTGISTFKKRIYYEIIEYDPVVDSSDMNMTDWVKIATTIEENYDKFNGFVVLHGTDTMAYTSSALSFMLQNLGKSVVVTGSQLSMAQQRNDGQSNFQGALIVAGHYTIPEVTLFFDNKLLRGNRATKVHASGLTAFDSPNLDPLMKFGIDIFVDWDNIFKQTSLEPFTVHKKMNSNINIVRLFPGIRLAAIVDACKEPVQGVILQSFGAGNCPERREVLDAFKQATDRGVIIVNITQCVGGRVSDAYRSGKILLTAGVLLGGDMTLETSLAKLSFALANEKLSLQQRKAFIAQNICGEQTIEGSHKFSMSNPSFIKELSSALGAQGKTEYQELRSHLTPVLMCAGASTGNKALVLEFLDDGYHVNCADYDGRTPLHIASKRGDLDMVQLLLSKGALVHAQDSFGHTPLRDAVLRKREKCVEALVGAGALLHMSAMEMAMTLCTLAAENDVVSLKLYIVAGIDVNAVDYDNRTALHVTCRRGKTAFAQELLKQNGIQKEIKDIFGVTPIEEAKRYNHTDLVALLSE